MLMTGFGSLGRHLLRHHMAMPPRGGLAGWTQGRNVVRLASTVGVVAPKQRDIVTVVPGVPGDFPVPTDLEQYIDRPEIARANMVLDKEHPDGVQHTFTMNRDPLNRSVLQQHVDFFDEDGDGVIWIKDTRKGLRRIGTPPILAFFAAIFINVVNSWKSMPGWRLTSLLFPIYTDNISKARHGSDSLVYDYEGRFQPVKFEEIFTKFDKGGKLGLAKDELMGMIKHNKQMLDNFGNFASWTEWSLAFNLFSEMRPDPENPAKNIQVFPKDRIRGIYDGSIFYLTAQRLEGGAASHGAKQS
jgi:peroxygenase